MLPNEKYLLRIFTVAFLLALLTGCAVSARETKEAAKQRVLESYYAQIDKSDGIHVFEAQILAQGELIYMGQEKEYDLQNPEVISGDNQTWVIRFRPRIRTLEDMHKKPYMEMTVRKDSGDITRQRIYHEQ